MRALALVPLVGLCLSCSEEPRPPSLQPLTAAELAVRARLDGPPSARGPSTARAPTPVPARTASTGSPGDWAAMPFVAPWDYGAEESVRLALGAPHVRPASLQQLRVLVRSPGRTPVNGAHVFAYSGEDFLARGITDSRGELLLETTGASPSLRLQAVLPGLGLADLEPSINADNGYEGTLRGYTRAGLPRPVDCEAGPFKPFLDEFLPGLCLEQSPGELVRLPAAFLRYDQEVEQYAPASLHFRSPRGPDGQLTRGDLSYSRRAQGMKLASASFSFEGTQVVGPALRRALELLSRGLGAPQVSFEKPGRTGGDSHCGTGTSAGSSARWTFAPAGGYSSVVLAANGGTSEDVEELLRGAHGFVLSLRRDPARQ